MDELIAFLNARLDEDETAAKAATQGEWYWTDPMQFGSKMALVAKCPGGHQMIVPSSRGDVFPSRYDAEHIARHDPARVLADVAAKRAVVAAYVDAVRMHGLMEEADDDAKWDWLFKSEAFEQVVRLLALPYADHPDYSEMWRP